MSIVEEIAASRTPRTGRFSVVILLLFVGSGCSALIYEMVWFHLLRLVVGASSISLAVLLTSFMGGMCLGSVLLPRFVGRRRHPLRVYAALEIGIAAFGLLMLVILPQVGRVYTSVVGHGYGSILLRAVVCVVCLLPPTMLMGATLPAVARWVKSSQRGLSQLGFFYGGNIFGAVVGTMLAGFVLLRVYDVLIATYVAVVINIVVAAIAIALARRDSYEALERAAAASDSAKSEHGGRAAVALAGTVKPSAWSGRTIAIATMLSGLTALGAEVVWTRQLSLLFGATVYTFTLILATFLIGLGIGSSAGAAIARYTKRPRLLFGLCQMGLIAAIPLGAYLLTDVIHRWQPNTDFLPSLLTDMWPRFGYDMLRCGIAMLPATLLWGASFPLALAALAGPDQDAGKLVARLYASNTVGAIIGACGVSAIAIPLVGTRNTQILMAAIAAASALLVLTMADGTSAAAAKKTSTASAPPRSNTSLRRIAITGGWLALLAIGCVQLVPATPLGLISYGRFTEQWENAADFLHTAEGVNASVAVSRTRDYGDVNLHVAGKIVASNIPIDMRLQRMLGHLPALMHGEPKSVLIVGCGAAVTAGSFVIYPSIERIVICEIEPQVPIAARKYFAGENYDVLNDPRTEVIYDDARHYMATSAEKFDIITSDPIHPWVRGAASMYTEEYYDLVKRRLNPGGIVTQWVPLYETSMEAVKSEIGTFMQAFSNGTIWNSDLENLGYDTILLGSPDPLTIHIETLQQRISDNPQLSQSLRDVDLGSALALLVTYAGQAADLTDWLADAQINRDRSLRLQYLAGLALDRYDEELIYGEIRRHRTYPSNLFVVSDQRYEEVLRRGF